MKKKPKHCSAWGVFTKGGRFLASFLTKRAAMVYVRLRMQPQTVRKVTVVWQ